MFFFFTKKVRFRRIGRPSCFIIAFIIAFMLFPFGVTLVKAETVTASLVAGTNPYAVAVNPMTNKIYVANYNSNNVSVIDGATNSTITVTTGT